MDLLCTKLKSTLTLVPLSAGLAYYRCTANVNRVSYEGLHDSASFYSVIDEFVK